MLLFGAYDQDFNFIPYNLPTNLGPASDEANALRTQTLGEPSFAYLQEIDVNDLFTDATLQGINAEVNYQGDSYLVTFIPAWRKTEQASGFVSPGFNVGSWQDDAEQLSLELRISGELSDAFEYIGGLYYFDEDISGNNTLNQEYILPLEDYTTTNRSDAIFGEMTYHLNGEHRFILGARYTKDDKKMQGQLVNFISFCGGAGASSITPPDSFAQGCHIPGNLPNFPTLDNQEEVYQYLIQNGFISNVPTTEAPVNVIPLNNGIGQVLQTTEVADSSFSDDAITYKLSYEWDITLDSMIYFGFSTGYRAGGLEPGKSGSYDSEKIDAFTFGSNNLFLDGDLQLNFEAFHWEYEDQQINYFTVDQNGVLDRTTQNVGATSIQGFDIDAFWRASDDLTFTFKLAYLSTEYDDLVFVTSPPRNNINCPFEVTGTTTDGTPEMTFNCSGRQALFSPKWATHIGFEYTVPVGSYELVFSADSRWQDEQQSGFFYLEHEVIEAYSTTNMNVDLRGEDWTLGVYAHNIEDENRISMTQTPLVGITMAQYNVDMTYGARFTYNF